MSLEQEGATNVNEDEVIIPPEQIKVVEDVVVDDVTNGEQFDPRKHLTEQQIHTLDAFKARVAAYDMNETERAFYLDDMCLLRYLRAREFHADKSYKMIIDTIEWKRIHKPETITLEEVEPIARCGCVYLHGKDKRGRPILYARPYREDLLTPKLVADTQLKFRHLMYWVETGFSMMDKSKGVETFTLITDYKNFGRRHMDTKTNMEVLGYLNNHCPERMGKTFFLDPPFLFWVGWKVISPFLSQATLNKVNFIKSSSKGDRRTYPEVFKVIDEETLEAEYGGKDPYVWNYEEYAKSVNK